jgi:hypothetical protein
MRATGCARRRRGAGSAAEAGAAGTPSEKEVGIVNQAGGTDSAIVAPMAAASALAGLVCGGSH